MSLERRRKRLLWGVSYGFLGFSGVFCGVSLVFLFVNHKRHGMRDTFMSKRTFCNTLFRNKTNFWMMILDLIGKCLSRVSL